MLRVTRISRGGARPAYRQTDPTDLADRAAIWQQLADTALSLDDLARAARYQEIVALLAHRRGWLEDRLREAPGDGRIEVLSSGTSPAHGRRDVWATAGDAALNAFQLRAQERKLARRGGPS